MAITSHLKTLEAMWDFMESINSHTTDAELRKVTTFFEPNAIAYLNGMSSPPCTSHASLVAAVKALTGFWVAASRKVTVHVESADGLVIVNAMENDLKILDEGVDRFPECEVVKFSEAGLIKEYLLFCDPSPILAILAKGASEEARVG